MKCMAPWLQGQKFQVMLKQLTLHVGQGQGQDQICFPEFGRVAVEITEKGHAKETPAASARILPYYAAPKMGVSYTTVSKFIKRHQPLKWEVENLCESLYLVEKEGRIRLCQITFRILYGDQSLKSKSKLVVIGRASLNIAELAKEMTGFQSDVEIKLPIDLVIGVASIEATLLVRLCFTKMKDFQDLLGIFEITGEWKKDQGFLRRVKSLTKYKNPKKRNSDQHEEIGSSYESDESSAFDSEGSNESSSSSSSHPELSNSTDTDVFRRKENGWDGTAQTKLSLLALKRKMAMLTFGPTRKKPGPDLTPDSESAIKEDGMKDSSLVEFEDDNCKDRDCVWREKELVSRDGKAKLKAKVFFASFDQRSEKASGESACTALVALVAHWLHENEGMPTRSEFETLITEGSQEWRKLCNNDAYSNLFPDKHLDLETVIGANVRPVRIHPELSFTGFFSPEKFECLKGAMSFDEIWREIESHMVSWEPRVYIVSWNDHFFVLKMEVDVCYIIDSLGERLFEGCRQAYIMKFDKSSLMYAKKEPKPEARAPREKTKAKTEKKDDGDFEVIRSGKECCKEFIKRFFAAVPVQQLVEEEKNGTLSNACVHRQLQIDFHFSSSRCI